MATQYFKLFDKYKKDMEKIDLELSKRDMILRKKIDSLHNERDELKIIYYKMRVARQDKYWDEKDKLKK